MSTQKYHNTSPMARFFVVCEGCQYTIYNLVFSPIQMAELGKKIDEQALATLTSDLDKQLAQKSSITGYNKLKATQQVLADLFSDDTYASHNTKVGLEKTKAALKKIISAREAKGGVMPQYIEAMKKDLETVEYRLSHLEKLNDTTSFEVNQSGEILVDDIFLKESNDIARTGIDVKHEGITLGGNAVKVSGVDNNKEGDLLCNVEGIDFTISHEGDKISVKPSTVLIKGQLELTLLGIYGKEEAGNTTKRVGQEKKITIKASAEDQKTFKEQDDAATLKAITDFDSVQNISGETIDTFANDQILLYASIDTVFNTHDTTKTYWKYLDDAQKKLFIDDLVRSHPGFSTSELIKQDEAKDTFFKSVLDYKHTTAIPKTISEMSDAFLGFHKNTDLQRVVSEGLQSMLQKNIDAATNDVVKDNLAQFYKKFKAKNVSEFDIFYNKLENDQTGAFTKIKEAFETVKQDTMLDAFKQAMGENPHVKGEKINDEGVWENIPGDQQARFCMQMVFQKDANSAYPTWDRIQYIPALHHQNILGLESFLETFKDEIAELAKKEKDPAKLRGTIKTLILEKLSDTGVKNILKNKLLKTFGDKISQNIAGGSTNVLNEMNKFAIDAKAFQPGYKNSLEQTPSTSISPSTASTTTPVADSIDTPDDFDILEYEEGQEMNINASISDVSRVYEDQAEHVGEEALRAEYEALGKFDVFKGSTYTSMLKRMKLYFFRETIKNKTKKEELEKLQTNGVDIHRSELTAAADRHERMFNDTQWNNQKDADDRINGVVQNINDSRIDDLCKEYLDSATGMTDKDFEDRFNALVATNKTIASALNGKNMKHTASNILLKLRAERGYKTMMEGILHALETYATNNDDNAYQTSVKQHITTYVNLTQRAISPNLQKALTAPGTQVDKYRRWMRHEIGMAKMQANTLKIKLGVLSGGKGAYEVNNRDKDKNLVAKLGTWIRKNPKKALAISIGSTLGFGIFAGSAAATSWALFKSATWMVSRKMGDYTEEQKGQEKKLVRELDQEKNRLTNLKAFVNKASFRQKAKNYRTFRQGRLYANTTQFEFMNDAKAGLANIRTQMLDLNKTTLRSAVAEALARIDYYVSSGHNFLGQKDDKEMEETMNDLQKIVEAGTETLATTKDDMRTDAKYIQVKGELDSNYTTMRKKFKGQRRWTGAKYGAAALALSGGLRHLLGNDVHKHSYSGGDHSTPNVPPHNPNTPPVVIKPPVTVPTQTDIYSPNFDDKHHDLFKLSKLPGGSIDALSGGMNPEEILEHCSHVNVLDPKISANVIKHMAQLNAEGIQELAPKDVPNVLSAVNQLVNDGRLPPSQYLQDKVARYLYHFAERDAVLSKVVGGGGDAVKNIIKDTVTDGGAGQKGWLDSFLAGGETFGRYLLNIASVASPLYANTFLENPLVPDLNGKKPGEQGYVPTFKNTVVDPNKKPVPGGFANDNALNWIIRKGATPTTPAVVTPTQSTQSPSTPTINSNQTTPATNNTNSNNTTPDANPTIDPTQNPDNNVVILGPTDDSEALIQEELEKAQREQAQLEQKQADEFLLVLTGNLETLSNRYDGWIDVYKDIKAEFEVVKNETDLVKKISDLQSLKFRIEDVKNKLQGVKDLADKYYDDFKAKYDILTEPVKEKVKGKLSELQQLRRKTQTTIQEIGLFIQTLVQTINSVGTISAQPTVVSVPANIPAAVSKAPVVKNTVVNNNQSAVNNTNVPASPRKKRIVIDMLNEISIPDSKLDLTKFRNAVESDYNQYISIIKLLEGKQINLRNEINSIENNINKGNKVDQKMFDKILEEIKYFNVRADAFGDSFLDYTKKTDARLDQQSPLRDKRNDISARNDRIFEYDEKLNQKVDEMIQKNSTLNKGNQQSAKQSSKPAASATTVTLPKDDTTPSVAATNNTVESTPIITDDSILAAFKAIKGNKILRITKKDGIEVFNQYKALLEKNPDMYNYVASKKEIAINGILDKNTWVGQAK